MDLVLTDTSALTNYSAIALRSLICSREVSAREVVQAHIDQINDSNDKIRAVITLAEDRAITAANRLDDIIVRTGPVGPLHGIPIAHKDNRVTNGIRTTYGSKAFRNNVPTYDDSLVSAMSVSGGVSLCKSNIPEFVVGGYTDNDLFGPTCNPYDLSRSSGGSSGGAAAGLAAGMFPLADGTDIGGSLRIPASFCNVVGLRPSYGVVPDGSLRDGFASLLTAGPMARSVEDVALLLSVLVSPDQIVPVGNVVEAGYVNGRLPTAAVGGTRVAFSTDLSGRIQVDGPIRDSVLNAARVFSEAGAFVTEAHPDFDGLFDAYEVLRAVDFATSWGLVIDANQVDVSPSLVEKLQRARTLPLETIAHATRMRTEAFRRFSSFMRSFDLFILPVSPTLPFDATGKIPVVPGSSTGEAYTDWMQFLGAITLSGHPAMSIPGGFSPDGLPLGIQLIGPFKRDFALLALALEFEKRTRYGQRRPEAPAQ